METAGYLLTKLKFIKHEIENPTFNMHFSEQDPSGARTRTDIFPA